MEEIACNSMHKNSIELTVLAFFLNKNSTKLYSLKDIT